MKMLNKLASFIAIGIIGYLAYSAISNAAAGPVAESKELPEVTEKMLKPVFINPKDNASPANRDPFDIAGLTDNSIAEQPAGANELQPIGTGGDSVRFPNKLMGILQGDDGQQLALIGDEVYGVGSKIRLADSNTFWDVSNIENETVILTCNGLRAVLKFTNDEADSKEEGMIEGQKKELK